MEIMLVYKRSSFLKHFYTFLLFTIHFYLHGLESYYQVYISEQEKSIWKILLCIQFSQKIKYYILIGLRFNICYTIFYLSQIINRGNITFKF